MDSKNIKPLQPDEVIDWKEKNPVIYKPVFGKEKTEHWDKRNPNEEQLTLF